jgi:Phosphatidylserine/phosphatidylglycerophosphate/cardiolipin synthases and related enzymes
MEADYAVQISTQSYLNISSNNAYNFGIGDFTLTALFQTQSSGTIISSKTTNGQSQDNAGWLLVLKPDGSFKMATDDSFQFYEVCSKKTSALDGSWHSVAAVRDSGEISIYFDGVLLAVTPNKSKNTTQTPLNISNNTRVLIGNCDQSQEPYRQFVGMIEDVSIWNRALDQSDIKRTMFNMISPEDEGLVGFWEFNKNFNDSSTTRNSITPIGSIRWASVFNCVWAESVNKYAYCAIDLEQDIKPDIGAKINCGGIIIVPPCDKYNFGIGDFTLTALFQTQSSGTIISSKTTNGQSQDNAGWLLVLKPDGSFKMATDDSFQFYEVCSQKTSALDGSWHSVAAVRDSGEISIYFDGVLLAVTPNKSKNTTQTPLNISNNTRVLIGNCDQSQEPYRQFVGMIDDVTIWKRALPIDQIQWTRFSQITSDSPYYSDLVGYWKMDNDFNDSSVIGNHGTSNGSVNFDKVYYVSSRYQTIKVDKGTPFLYGALLDKSSDTASFPKGAYLKVFRPDGTQLNTETCTENLFVHLEGKSVSAFIVQDPVPGEWKFYLEASQNIPVLFSLQTTPTKDIPGTISNALNDLYGHVPLSHARLMALNDNNALNSFTRSWSDVARWAGMTIVAVSAVIAIPTQLLFRVGISLGIKTTFFELLGLQTEIVNECYEAASIIGIPSSLITGDQSSGSVSLVVDGEAYFPLFRDLLLAVSAGHYEPNGITLPDSPTFENLMKKISDAGKTAYVLMWDTNRFYDVMQSCKDLRYFKQWLIEGDPSVNQQTKISLEKLSNVSVALEDYRAFWSLVPLNSQHQKITIVSVNNIKCALVGGFNIFTNYWDDQDHPMYDRNNFHAWHDTAVFLQGPVVDMIEKEFDRRWRITKIDASVDDCGTYAKVACWQIDHDGLFDNTSRFPYKNPVTKDYQYPIDVLITNSQYSSTPITKIKDKIIERIRTAQQYMYFENFAFHDADLVKEIIQKLKGSKKDFRCIININHPTKGNDNDDQNLQFYMSRIAFGALILSTDQWSVLHLNDKKINRFDCSDYHVDLPDNKPIEYATFVYKNACSDEIKTIPIRDSLKNIETMPDCKIILSSPVRYFDSLEPNLEKFQLPGLSPNFRSIYVHSKLAIFDDSYVIVGSANFTTRSMMYDGECSVGINSNVKAKEIREAIFQHWGVTARVDTEKSIAKQWYTTMNEFACKPSKGVGVVPLSIGALYTGPLKWTARYFEFVSELSKLS